MNKMATCSVARIARIQYIAFVKLREIRGLKESRTLTKNACIRDIRASVQVAINTQDKEIRVNS